MVNDRVLVGGGLSASAGLSGPLLTDHTGKYLSRARDFQFSTGKGSQEEVARRPETLAYVSVSIILFVLPSSYLLVLPSVIKLHRSTVFSEDTSFCIIYSRDPLILFFS